jgi:hypothetical protein
MSNPTFRWLLGCVVVATVCAVIASPSRGMDTEATPPTMLKWEMQVIKTSVFPGEPIVLRLAVTNGGKESIAIMPHGIGDRPFAVEFRDVNDRVVAQGSSAEEPGVVSYKSGFTVYPGESVPRSLVVNHLCSTRLPPGKYHLLCRFTFTDSSNDATSGRKVGMGNLRTAELASDIEILPMDVQAYSEALAVLARKYASALDSRTTAGREAIELRISTAEALAFAEGDTAVPYQLSLLKDTRNVWATRLYALYGIQHNGSTMAVQGLMKYVDSLNPPLVLAPSELRLRDRVVTTVYEMRQHGTEATRQATEGFVKAHPRPEGPIQPMD